MTATPTAATPTPEELATPTTAEVITRLEAGDQTVFQAAAEILRAQTSLLNQTITQSAAARFASQAAQIAELRAERDELEREVKDYVSAITYATIRPRPPSQSIAWLKAWSTGDKAAVEELKEWKE